MKLYLILYSVLICNLSIAQPHIDTFDIYPGPSSSYPVLSCYGNTLYFTASDGVHGFELWAFYATDDTPVRLTDINPGLQHSVGGNLAITDDAIYFKSEYTDLGSELWSYRNGIATMEIDINPGKNGSNPKYLIAEKKHLYFYANNQVCEYNTDTKTLKCLNKTTPGLTFDWVQELAVLNGKVLFCAGENPQLFHLYEYDPTTGQAGIIKDSINTYGYTLLGNKIYFTGCSDNFGCELYEYDGATTPVRLSDLYPGKQSGIRDAHYIVPMNNELYFSGYDTSTSLYQLYKYTPSTKSFARAAITTQLPGSAPVVYTVLNNELYFTATDSINGSEIWKYDGTNTSRITNFIEFSTSIDELVAVGVNLFFMAKTPDLGFELYKYSAFTSGVQKLSTVFDAKVYPNPANNIAHLQLNLKHNTTLEVYLTDMHGRTVYKSGKVLYSAAKHTIDIPVQNLPPGNYVYSLQEISGNLVASGKLVKQ